MEHAAGGEIEEVGEEDDEIELARPKREKPGGVGVGVGGGVGVARQQPSSPAGDPPNRAKTKKKHRAHVQRLIREQQAHKATLRNMTNKQPPPPPTQGRQQQQQQHRSGSGEDFEMATLPAAMVPIAAPQAPQQAQQQVRGGFVAPRAPPPAASGSDDFDDFVMAPTAAEMDGGGGGAAAAGGAAALSSSFKALDKKGLVVLFDFDCSRATSSGVTKAIATIVNARSSPLTGLVCKVASPNHIRVKVVPPSATEVPALQSGILSPEFTFMNTLYSQGKPLKAELKMECVENELVRDL